MPLPSKDQIIRPYGGQETGSCLAVFDSNVPQYFAAAERAEFSSFLDAPHADFLVICDHPGVVACGGCYVRDAIGRLCWGMVHRGFQRKSVGTALLAFRLNHLFSALSASEARLDTSQHSAPFFAKFGFSVAQVEPDGFAPGIDCVKMQLSQEAWVRTHTRL